MNADAERAAHRRAAILGRLDGAEPRSVRGNVVSGLCTEAGRRLQRPAWLAKASSHHGSERRF